MKAVLASLIAVLIFSGCEEKREKEEVANTAQIKITQGAVKEQESKERELDKGEFYYSYKQKKEEKEKVEDEGRFTKLGAYRHIRSPYQEVEISLLVNKLSKDFLIYCSACHDDYANGVIGPSLLGKSGEYIYQQLLDFKSGKRENVLMEQLVKRLPESKLKALADEIAQFNEKVQKILKENSVKD